MTVSTTAVPVTYPGDGVTTVFSYPYKFLSTSDIKVYVGGVLKTLTTDYSVGAPSDSGANVTFVTAPGAASGIVFIQDPDSLQSSKLPSNGPFPSSTVERMVDKLTLQVQRLKSLLSRSLTLSDGDSTTASTVLPTPTASSLIGWNSSGNALQNYAGSSSALVSPAMVPVVGASTLALGRAALGAGVIGDALFLTATAAAARAAIGLAAGADIASASTLPLAARTGNIVRVTGTVASSATDLENGGIAFCYPTGAWPLTYHATNMPLQGGVNYTCQAGDLVIFARDGNGVLHVDVRKFDGQPIEVVAQNKGGTGYSVTTRQVAQVVVSQTGAFASGSTIIPLDDTIPQQTEGDQYLSATITPKNANSLLEIQVALQIAQTTSTAAVIVTAALFKDAAADAIAANEMFPPGAATNWDGILTLGHTRTAGDTLAQTFKVRMGPHVAATINLNGRVGARLLGGVASSYIIIKEYLP